MNKKYALRGNVTGRFYVVGRGFVATSVAGATKMTSAEATQVQDCGRKFGAEASTAQAVAGSWAVNYIRAENLTSTGQVKSDTRNPSKRRFATKDEAVQHGSRFGERRKRAGDENGTAGHVGFWVSESSDAVNSEINWKTGLTNPVGTGQG